MIRRSIFSPGSVLSPRLVNRSAAPPLVTAERKTRMQKAHLYESILLVNRGIDVAVQELERLKRAKYSGLGASCFDEKLTLFEIHRASLNSYLCNNVGRNEDLDLVRFEKKHHDFEKNALFEVQV